MEFTGPFCDLFYIQILDTFKLFRIHNQANLAGKVMMGYELNQMWSQVPSHDKGCVTCMHGNACTRHEVALRDPSLKMRSVFTPGGVGWECFPLKERVDVKDTPP